MNEFSDTRSTHRANNPYRIHRRAFLGGGTLCAASILTSAAFGPAQAAPTATTRLFGRVERKYPGLKKFPKWQGTLDKYFAEQQLVDKPCDRKQFGKCDLQEWAGFIHNLKASQGSEITIVDAVNREMNKRSYILDPVNWNLPDYWASPGEFLRKAGDCEDYGIAKFMTLRALGIAPERMRVVVLQDLNLGVAHAVMALNVPGDVLILDNQTEQVISHSRIRHYKPIYAVNEQSWWLFLPSA